MFQLHPQLAKDCIQIGTFDLSLLLLMNDSRYPWVILVPQRQDVTEIFELDPADQLQLMRESSATARALKQATHCDKMNIAAIGNMVSQLHVHHVARTHGDAAWPAPVWGKHPAIPYEQPQLRQFIALLIDATTAIYPTFQATTSA